MGCKEFMGGFARGPSLRCDAKLWLIAMQEFFASFNFLFFACMSTIQNDNVTAIVLTMAFVFIVSARVGLINPFVSLAACWYDVLAWDEMLWRMLFQFSGSFAGFFLLIAVTPFELRSGDIKVCFAQRGQSMHPLQVMLVEFCVTYLYMQFYAIVWSETKPNRLICLNARIVIVFITLIYPGLLNSGAGANIARILPPQVWYNDYTDLEAYLVPPLFAACLSPIIWKNVWGAPAKGEE